MTSLSRTRARILVDGLDHPEDGTVWEWQLPSKPSPA